MTEIYGPADIERASGGEINSDNLRNWIHSDLFNTPMKEPLAGKPREFPLAAVYEAILLKKFSQAGVLLAKAKNWNKEIVGRIMRQGVASIDKRGGQSGPASTFSAPQVILFHPDSSKPLILSDSEAGETINQAFYIARPKDTLGPADSICALHLPAIITKINNSLRGNK